MQVTELESALAEANHRLTRIDEADKRLAAIPASQPTAGPTQPSQHKPADSSSPTNALSQDSSKPVESAVGTAHPAEGTAKPADAVAKPVMATTKPAETPAVQKQ